MHVVERRGNIQYSCAKGNPDNHKYLEKQDKEGRERDAAQHKKKTTVTPGHNEREDIINILKYR